LTSRRPLPSDGEASRKEVEDPRVLGVRRLRAAGADVRVVVADVTDADEMRSLVRELADDTRLPLRGVLHAAGVSLPQFVKDIDRDSYAKVWEPKVIGGWVLHQATKDLDLDLFVCFSSIASSWGSQHLASYSAGN